jgi:hypothetical protein
MCKSLRNQTRHIDSMHTLEIIKSIQLKGKKFMEKQCVSIVVTYAQFDSNIRVLYVFLGFLKKYGPKYAEW